MKINLTDKNLTELEKNEIEKLLKREDKNIPNDLEQMWYLMDLVWDDHKFDNGPEYISTALQNWAKKQKIKLEYIQPGKPQQNAYIERYNRTVRYDWLNQYIFNAIEEVREFATKWLWVYNDERPKMAIGGITPKQKLALVA